MGKSVFWCFTVRFKFTLWYDPIIGVEKSRDISTSIIERIYNSLVILMKKWLLLPSKNWCRVSYYISRLIVNHDELEYAVFLPNLLTTFCFLSSSLLKIYNKIFTIFVSFTLRFLGDKWSVMLFRCITICYKLTLSIEPLFHRWIQIKNFKSQKIIDEIV